MAPRFGRACGRRIGQQPGWKRTQDVLELVAERAELPLEVIDRCLAFLHDGAGTSRLAQSGGDPGRPTSTVTS